MSDYRLFCRPTRPKGVIQFAAPHEAFNVFIHESVLTLDVCHVAGPMLPGSASISEAVSGTPEVVALEAARTRVMEEFTPIRPKSNSQCFTSLTTLVGIEAPGDWPAALAGAVWRS